MGSLIEATASPITGLLGGKGAYEGQKKQAEYADKALADYNENIDRSLSFMQPYANFGAAGMPMMLNAIRDSNYDREAALSDYYSSGEYAMMQDAANRNLLTQAESSGVGGSSVDNALMRIAPQMGSQHLSYLDAKAMDDFNKSLNFMNIGSSASTGMANLLSGGAAGSANLMLGKGEALAAKKAMPWMIAADQNKRAAEGAGAFADFFGGMFTGGMPMGKF